MCGLSLSETDLCEKWYCLHFVICGYTPFDDEDEDEQDQYVSLVESIYEFDDEDWGHVSKEAKDLVRKCLTVDQKQRYTAKQVLQHPWMNVDLKSDKILDSAHANLKKYTARRRLKRAMTAVRASVKMRMSLNSSALEKLKNLEKSIASSDVEVGGV